MAKKICGKGTENISEMMLETGYWILDWGLALLNQELRNSGTLEHWNTGTLEPWNFGTLELWNF